MSEQTSTGIPVHPAPEPEALKACGMQPVGTKLTTNFTGEVIGYGEIKGRLFYQLEGEDCKFDVFPEHTRPAEDRKPMHDNPNANDGARSTEERLREALVATVSDSEIRDGAIFITGDLRKEIAARGLAVVPVQQGADAPKPPFTAADRQQLGEAIDRTIAEGLGIESITTFKDRLTSDAAVAAAFDAILEGLSSYTRLKNYHVKAAIEAALKIAEQS